MARKKKITPEMVIKTKELLMQKNSQREVAVRMGISQNAVNNIYHGRYDTGILIKSRHTEFPIDKLLKNLF